MELNIPGRYKQIEGFEEYYITDDGRVFCYRDGRCGWHGLHELKPKKSKKAHKYYAVQLGNGKEQRTVMIHRLVAKYFVDGYFDGAVVNHIDGDETNNHCTNLEWVTQKENINKSYITSGVDQVRNYLYWVLISPEGEHLAVFKGGNALRKYIEQNNLDTSFSSLRRNGYSRGYRFEKVTDASEAVTTTSA